MSYNMTAGLQVSCLIGSSLDIKADQRYDSGKLLCHNYMQILSPGLVKPCHTQVLSSIVLL